MLATFIIFKKVHKKRGAIAAPRYINFTSTNFGSGDTPRHVARLICGIAGQPQTYLRYPDATSRCDTWQRRHAASRCPFDMWNCRSTANIFKILGSGDTSPFDGSNCLSSGNAIKISSSSVTLARTAEPAYGGVCVVYQKYRKAHDERYVIEVLREREGPQRYHDDIVQNK